MFDLDDTDAELLVGGEYVELAQANPLVEAYAADVGQLADATGIVAFARADRTAASLGGLADEGVDEYGTLFGSLIGTNTGRATNISGATIIGPASNAGSGKVTVWAQAGLYGVNGQRGTPADADLAAMQANAVVTAETDSGLLGSSGNGSSVATYVGAMTDSSLVSTTNAAAGLDAETEYHVVFYLGNAQA
jgi:hypothetical protein